LALAAGTLARPVARRSSNGSHIVAHMSRNALRRVVQQRRVNLAIAELVAEVLIRKIARISNR
jgi:hypothetical protein